MSPLLKRLMLFDWNLSCPEAGRGCDIVALRLVGGVAYI